MTGILLERVTLVCESCHKQLITRKTSDLDKYRVALLAAVEKHKAAQPDKPHEIRAKLEATA